MSAAVVFFVFFFFFFFFCCCCFVFFMYFKGTWYTCKIFRYFNNGGVRVIMDKYI